MANDDKEIDRVAREGEKSEWQERSAPAASDPVSDDERRGLNILGQSDPRGDGSIRGASDPNEGDVPGEASGRGGAGPGAPGGAPRAGAGGP